MPRDDPSQEFLTVAELADRHKQAPKTLYNKIAAGTIGIPVVRLPGGDPRFRLSDVLAAERKWTQGAIRE
jgi:hypothetical protein